MYLFDRTNFLDFFCLAALNYILFTFLLKNKMTGEYSCIMIKSLQEKSNDSSNWLEAFNNEFCLRHIRQSQNFYRNFDSMLCTALICKNLTKKINENALDVLVTPFDIRRLQKLAEQRINMMNVFDIIPNMAQLYFYGMMPVALNRLQQVILYFLNCII